MTFSPPAACTSRTYGEEVRSREREVANYRTWAASGHFFLEPNLARVELKVGFALSPVAALVSKRFKSSTTQKASSELMYFSTRSLRSTMVFGLLFERNLLKYSSGVPLSRIIIAEELWGPLFQRNSR